MQKKTKVFRLTLTVPEQMRAISNMPIVQETRLDDHKKRVEFQPSPVMSSYLLAVVVGEFDFLSEFVEGVEVFSYLLVLFAFSSHTHTSLLPWASTKTFFFGGSVF